MDTLLGKKPKLPEINPAGLRRLNTRLAEIKQGRLFHSWGDPIFHTKHGYPEHHEKYSEYEAYAEQERGLKEEYCLIKAYIYELQTGNAPKAVFRESFNGEIVRINSTKKSKFGGVVLYTDFIKIPGGKFEFHGRQVEVSPFFLAKDFLTNFSINILRSGASEIEMITDERAELATFKHEVAAELENLIIPIKYKGDDIEAVVSLPTIAQLTWATIVDEFRTYDIPEISDTPVALSGHPNHYGLHHMVGVQKHFVRDTDINFPASAYNPIYRDMKKKGETKIMTFGSEWLTVRSDIEQDYLQWWSHDKLQMAGIRPTIQLIPKRKPIDV